MTKSRQWIAGTALVAVVVLVAGMFLFVQPRRSQASALRGQTATHDAANQALQNKIATLKAQQQDLPNQQAILDTIRQQLPQTPNLPSLVRSLTDLAKASGVELVALAAPHRIRPLRPRQVQRRQVRQLVLAVPPVFSRFHSRFPSLAVTPS